MLMCYRVYQTQQNRYGSYYLLNHHEFDTISTTTVVVDTCATNNKCFGQIAANGLWVGPIHALLFVNGLEVESSTDCSIF